MKRLTVWAGALALALLTTAPLLANVRATLLLKSGNRVSGDLVDMNASGFTIAVNGNNRKIPAGDVAVIDFRGNARNLPAAEVSRAAGGRGIAVLEGGRIIEGQLYDIGGTSPLRLTFDTSSGRVNHTSSEVARIYLSAVPGSTTGVTAPPTTPSRPGDVIVSGNRQWTPTGVYVNRGDRVTFNATGEIQLSDDPNDVATPAGARSGRFAQRAPMTRTLAGALIGRIGNSEPFGVGNQPQLTMPASGELFLGVNDDVVADNRGEFHVRVQGGNAYRNRRQ